MTLYLVTLLFAMPGCRAGLARSPSRLAPAAVIRAAQASHDKQMWAHSRAGDSVEQRSCRKFVAEFYAWYLAKAKKGDPLQAALRQRKACFSADLARKLAEDRAAASRSPNEIVGLDFDPVLNGQDFGEKYVPGAVTVKDGRYFVDVGCVFPGNKRESAAVTPVLRRVAGRWVFANFIYKSEGKVDDLISILGRLKAERRKGSRGR
ncbi:MAG TPA: hypothetical protein VKT77_10655 [Chthonomonadaceae bacterium]|nr:hypothetical protein [Chthonomonadaceae bacterium]